MTRHLASAVLAVALLAPGAAAQDLETIGSRALGMGGAFTAVASDATASWWNPAGLAAGAFLDLSVGRGASEPSPDDRARASWFALGTPPLGFSNYRLRSAGLQPPGATAGGSANRESDGGPVPVGAWELSQWGVTLVQTLVPGVHVGTTLKYLRGTVRAGEADPRLDAEGRLDAAEDLGGGVRTSRFDLDVGVLGVAGPVRLGVLARNLREPDFGAGGPRLPRQVRVGVAYDAAAVGGPGLVVAVDGDLRTVTTASGERRMLAAGVEQWLAGRRVGLRTGIRTNRAGARERVWTAGGSVRLTESVYVDGYLVRGRESLDRGWGFATRVSY